MWRALAVLLFAAPFAYGEDLRVDSIRESLTGTHIHYRQYLDGIPVIGGERVENIGIDGKREVLDTVARRSSSRIVALSLAPSGGDLVYLNVNGDARLVLRVIVEQRPMERYANYYDAASGALIRSDPLFWTAKGRVFDPNPVAKLNNPDLQDQNDSALAVPDAAYSIVDLPDLPSSGPLAGPNVQIVDTQAPFTIRADASQSLLFDRSQAQFEEVNAYYHIDHSQRYLQSLGYTGTRQIVGYSIPVDAHAANGTDNSYFVSGFTPGRGELFFGDGGTDDAEDSDIMLHEYGHAIQESIAPGAFGGTSSSQSRALGEGFGDYWSFSSTYAGTVVSGRDPFCIGDWDARCWKDDPSQFCGYPVGSDCLRRVDSSKTMADFIISDASGTEHKNGEIWSSALREIFMAMITRYGLDAGKRITDALVLEGTFGVPQGPTYALMARKLLDADSALNRSANVAVICSAMTARGILAGSDCAQPPRGEVTWFQSADQQTITITDARLIDDIRVQSSIVGAPGVQATLIGPDGTAALLKTAAQPLDIFRGRSAAGTWRLMVTSTGQPVTLAPWSLVIRFAGDQPAVSRPLSAGAQKHIAAVAHASGANGTLFISDVRILNRGPTAAQITLIFTPSGADGRTNFAAAKLVIAPSQIVALDDIVQTMMQSSGTGQLELIGPTDQLIVTSRTYTSGERGTFGQFIPSADPAEAIGSDAQPLSVPGLENSADFRSNIGFAEVSGAGGDVHVRAYDASGIAISDDTYAIAPFGHLQTHLNASGEALRAEVSVSGAEHVLAYGSVVDNHSGDAIFIPAARVRQGLLPAIHAAGANGTFWRTDVWLSNPSGALAQVVDLGGRNVVVPAAGSVVIRDVLGREGRGVLTATSSDGILVTSRTYTSSSGGTYGQFIPPGKPSIGMATLIGIENDAAFRTNIGLIAPSPANVRLIAYDGAGKEVWRSDVLAQGLTQFPLPVPLAAGRVTAQVLDGGSVVPYASVIDNQSGDPIYIVAQY